MAKDGVIVKMLRSGNFNIYKSLGAAQFSLIHPSFGAKGFLDKEGAVLLEVAPGDGNKDNPVWDWSKKINFAIGLPDIALLLDVTKGNPRLVHDNKGVLKTLELKAGEGKYEGTYMLSLSEGPKESRRAVTVPLSNGEYNLLMRLLVSAAPLLINWNPDNSVQS